MLKAHQGYNWREAWLDEAVLLAPGEKMKKYVQERASALPPLQPKSLPTKKRGRPRKRPAQEKE
jgi:hypothetical protein